MQAALTDRPVDALIIGGGPAGLSAAIVLAGHGWHTLLCEQKEEPVDKACGEGVMPTGVAHLQALGAAAYLAEGDFFPFAGICYHAAAGHRAAAAFAEGPGWGISRTRLSAALNRRAREIDNLEILHGVRAEPQERTARHITVVVGQRLIRTRLLIGADGLNSRVRRWAGLDDRPALRQRWGARQHFPLPPWSDYVEVYWGDGVEAYVTPCGPRRVNVAFLWDRMRYMDVQGGPALFSSLLKAFPRLQERLAGAEADDYIRAIGPLERRARAPIADGVLLLGDAAGYLDAITGEGISLAAAEALSLAETVAPLLHHPGRPGLSELASYARAYRAITRPYYQLTQLVLWLTGYPSLAGRLIAILQQRPALFQHLLSANMGLASPWSARVLARLLFVL